MIFKKNNQLTLANALLMACYLRGKLVEGQDIKGLPVPRYDFVDTSKKFSAKSLENAKQTSFAIDEVSKAPMLFFTLKVDFNYSE